MSAVGDYLITGAEVRFEALPLSTNHRRCTTQINDLDAVFNANFCADVSWSLFSGWLVTHLVNQERHNNPARVPFEFRVFCNGCGGASEQGCLWQEANSASERLVLFAVIRSRGER